MTGNLSINIHDIILAFLFGSLQYAPGFICLTLGSRTTESAKVGIFAFTEAIAGPIWAWIFISENPSLGVFVGGAIIFCALLLKTFKNDFETMYYFQGKTIENEVAIIQRCSLKKRPLK